MPEANKSFDGAVPLGVSAYTATLTGPLTRSQQPLLPLPQPVTTEVSVGRTELLKSALAALSAVGGCARDEGHPPTIPALACPPAECGAGNRDRTGDIHLGKMTLYQLSYARECGGAGAPPQQFPTCQRTPPGASGQRSGQMKTPRFSCLRTPPGRLIHLSRESPVFSTLRDCVRGGLRHAKLTCS